MAITLSLLAPFYHTTMSGCTLRFAQNSSLRTTLVDEATGSAKYKIDTPVRIARSVTRIRKLDSPAQPPPHREEDDPDSGKDTTNKGEKNPSSNGDKGDNDEEGDGTDTELPETSDEMARIYWKYFSPDRIIFRGRITTRSEFLPKNGKLKG